MYRTKRPNPWQQDPDDDRIPIGPGDTVSMQRACAVIAVIVGREFSIKTQLPEHLGQSRVRRAAQRVLSDVTCLHEQRFNFFCIHAASVDLDTKRVYTHFPTPFLNAAPGWRGCMHHRLPRQAALCQKRSRYDQGCPKGIVSNGDTRSDAQRATRAVCAVACSCNRP